MRVSGGGMFTPRHTPLKEGRSLPGLPYAGPSKRGLKSRQGAILLLLLICIPVIYFLSSSSSSSDIPSQSTTPLDHSDAFAPHLDPVLRPPPNEASRQQEPPLRPGAAGQGGPQSPGEGRFAVPQAGGQGQPPVPNPKSPSAAGRVGEDEEPVSLREDGRAAQPKAYSPGSAAPRRPATESNSFSERPRFEKALRRVISLLPGEMEGRDLLRQVEGTGKEKLREMGLRVREYKKFFEAWEDLHLTSDEEGGTYIRDDVIQYLRHHTHQSSADDLDETGIAQTVHSYEAYRYFLVKFGQLLFPWTAPYFPDHMTLHAHFKRGGRGIVLTAGDDQAPYLLTTIPTFRKLGCNLPIEVMYLGDSDLSEDYRADLEALDGVITRDIAQMVNDEGWKLAGWAAKPFAILHSSFREVIFIDADSLFFTNPEVLFDDPSYQKTGALFFRDRLIMPELKKRWLQQILPKPISRQVKQSRFWTGDSGHMQESGVVVVDKWRHFMSMLLVTRMNGPDRDGNKDEGRIGVYDMVYGDKETFWIGWELVGDLDYAFHQGDAGTMGTVQEPKLTDEEKEKAAKAKAEKAAKPPKVEKPKKKKKKPVLDENGDIMEGVTVEVDDEAVEEADQAEGEEIEIVPTRDLEPEPETYTICSPQLLHLDLSGKPLWFNGWLQDNKFADKKQKKFGKFLHYLIEPHDIREPGQWQLEESNMCCLTTDAPLKRDFTAAEKGVLQMMINQAREVGISG